MEEGGEIFSNDYGTICACAETEQSAQVLTYFFQPVQLFSASEHSQRSSQSRASLKDYPHRT